MNRIRRAFERRFRELLAVLNARDREAGVQWLFAHAEKQAELGRDFSFCLAQENVALAEKVHRLRRRRNTLLDWHRRPLVCDAGLGGLARWLRAAGCDAIWMKDVADADLVLEAERRNGIVITTDSPLLERKPIAQGRVAAIWVPPTLRKMDQLRLVSAELDLPESDSRCMRCGGELIEVDKNRVRDRIPPKTFLWVNEYFECARCGKLYWHGTHWREITARLQAV